jgi:DNA-binding NarL/FixJ family response regulator
VTARPATVIIADDHPPTRAGVRSALEADGFEIVAECSTGAAAVEAARAHHPDVCLLDIHMSDNGIAAAAEITASLPGTAVVMLTVSRNDADLFDAVRAGAAGYLVKDMDPGRLSHALRGVLAGEAALPRALVARLMDEFRDRAHRRTLPVLSERGIELTKREWEVLELLREGLGTAEIAGRLFISSGTVRTHVAAILTKLRSPDRKAALRLFDVPNGGEGHPAAF